MGDYSTIGTYRGPAPQDPNAELRKLFTVRENQQDGLASILNYAQKKVGFLVGGTDTEAFRKVLHDEFPDILIYKPADYAKEKPTIKRNEHAAPVAGNTLPVPQSILDHLPRDTAEEKEILEKVQSSPYNSLVRSVIEFITFMDSRDLTLDIKEQYTINVNGFYVEGNRQNAYEVNRIRMAERADWLVDHLGLKDSMEEWCRRITGHA
ncbi:hypothetical protein BGW41_003460 [Actinomortierella wolfii]|nr:hypothetical protein BGW41_003460 [Actinomortierella wolfii]